MSGKRIVLAVVALAVLLGGAWFLSASRTLSPSSHLAAAVPEIGKPAPAFSLNALSGKRVRLSEFRGRPVFLNFWATWCPYCVSEFGAIDAAYQEYGATGKVVFLAINSGESPETAGDYFAKTGYTMPVLLDRDTAVSQRYLVQGLPTSYFINRNGIIQDKVVGALDGPGLRLRLDALLR